MVELKALSAPFTKIHDTALRQPLLKVYQCLSSLNVMSTIGTAAFLLEVFRVGKNEFVSHWQY